MSNLQELHNKQTWKNMPVDLAHGTLVESKLQEIDRWIWDATDQHPQVLFLKLTIRMPVLVCCDHAAVLMDFQNQLLIELCTDLECRFRSGEKKHPSIVRLFWACSTDGLIDVYICLNQALWRGLGSRSLVTGMSLDTMIDQAWVKTLRKHYGAGGVIACRLQKAGEFVLDRHSFSFSNSFDALFFSMSSMARLTDDSGYRLSFANSSASTEIFDYC